MRVGVVNARFTKPLDTDVILKAADECGFVITIEENAAQGGFGSAVLECINSAGRRSDHVRVLAIPDEFVEHGERAELLADLGLDADGLVKVAQELAGFAGNGEGHSGSEIQSESNTGVAVASS